MHVISCNTCFTRLILKIHNILSNTLTHLHARACTILLILPPPSSFFSLPSSSSFYSSSSPSFLLFLLLLLSPFTFLFLFFLLLIISLFLLPVLHLLLKTHSVGTSPSTPAPTYHGPPQPLTADLSLRFISARSILA